MVTKRKGSLSARRTAIRVEEVQKTSQLLIDCYSDKMIQMIDKAKREAGLGRQFAKFFNADFVDAYQTKRYGRSVLVKKTIEDWLHTRHANGEITLQYIDKYVHAPVNVNQVLVGDSAREIPWGPLHEVGSVIWENSLKFLGCVNSSDKHHRTVSSIKTTEQFQEFLAEIASGNIEIMKCFAIQPGEDLNFKV